MLVVKCSDIDRILNVKERGSARHAEQRSLFCVCRQAAFLSNQHKTLSAAINTLPLSAGRT